jgi:DNA-directed RNA polymerase subunit beta'
MEDIGDTDFLPEEVVDKFKFREGNARVVEAGGRPATGKRILLGLRRRLFRPIRSSPPRLSRRSRACSPKPLSNGKADYLRRLRKNVIMGRLIPAGTGMEYYGRVKIAGEDVIEEEPLPEPKLAFERRSAGLFGRNSGPLHRRTSEDLGEEALGAEEI